MSLPTPEQFALSLFTKAGRHCGVLRCNHCGILGPPSAFNRTSSTPEGYARWCHECTTNYFDANRERIREKDRAYHAAHREERGAKFKEWYTANAARMSEKAKAAWAALTPQQREAERDRQRAWAASNPGKVQVSRRKTYLKHRAKRAERSKARYRENKHHILCIKRSSQLRRRGADGAYTDHDIAALYAIQEGRCAYCGVALGSRYDIDHIIPLSRGGSNWPSNLALACKTCNRRKWAKTAEEFAVYLERCPE